MLKNITLTTLLAIFLFSLLSAQNNSLCFDGNDDYVSMGDVLDLGTSDFTIEAWIYVEGTTTLNKIINKGLTIRGTPETAGYAIRASLDNPTSIDFTVGNSDGTFRRIQSTGIVLNSWQHVAGVRDGNSIYLYINGVEVAAGTTPVVYNVDTNIPFAIGALHRGAFGRTSEFMDGKIDEVRIWNLARTETEIQSSINTELVGTESGLIAYYKFDKENSSCDIEDCNSNENHGSRDGVAGDNNLPQFSANRPALTDISCGVPVGCAFLPVELNMFLGEKNEKAIVLSWQTNSEVNNLGFELQRSINGTEWRTIHFADGARSSSVVNDYRYQDDTPFSGLNYYRLRQIDFDGASTFSKVIIVEFNDYGNKINIFPNPSNGLVYIRFANPSRKTVRATIYDNTGRVVWKGRAIENRDKWKEKVNINSPGIYFIKYQIGKSTFTEKIIVT